MVLRNENGNFIHELAKVGGEEVHANDQRQEDENRVRHVHFQKGCCIFKWFGMKKRLKLQVRVFTEHGGIHNGSHIVPLCWHCKAATGCHGSIEWVALCSP
ncbi:unnamed protein product [Urochloa humidicola]